MVVVPPGVPVGVIGCTPPAPPITVCEPGVLPVVPLVPVVPVVVVPVDGPGWVGAVGVTVPAGTLGLGLIWAPAGSPNGRFGTN